MQADVPFANRGSRRFRCSWQFRRWLARIAALRSCDLPQCGIGALLSSFSALRPPALSSQLGPGDHFVTRVSQ